MQKKKIEIYEETKKNREYREDLQKKFLCSLKKKYLWVVLLHLEMNNKDSWINLQQEGEPDNSSWANWIGM